MPKTLTVLLAASLAVSALGGRATASKPDRSPDRDLPKTVEKAEAATY
jgi:hypothetical protein